MKNIIKSLILILIALCLCACSGSANATGGSSTSSSKVSSIEEVTNREEFIDYVGGLSCDEFVEAFLDEKEFITILYTIDEYGDLAAKSVEYDWCEYDADKGVIMTDFYSLTRNKDADGDGRFMTNSFDSRENVMNGNYNAVGYEIIDGQFVFYDEETEELFQNAAIQIVSAIVDPDPSDWITAIYDHSQDKNIFLYPTGNIITEIIAIVDGCEYTLAYCLDNLTTQKPSGSSSGSSDSSGDFDDLDAALSEIFGQGLITLGSYNGTPLNWVIISKDGNSARLLCTRVIDVCPMQDGEGFIEYEDTYVYKWMNGGFVSSFSCADATVTKVELPRWDHGIDWFSEVGMYLRFNDYAMSKPHDEPEFIWMDSFFDERKAGIENSSINAFLAGDGGTWSGTGTQIGGLVPIITVNFK